MKFSFSNILNSLVSGLTVLFKRFPVTTLLIILEFVGFVVLVGIPYEDILANNSFRAFLAYGLLANVSLILTSITLQLSFERSNLKNLQKIFITFGTLFVLAFLSYLWLSVDYASYEFVGGGFTGNMYRVLILVLLSFLSVFVVPFLKDGNSNTWWNFTISSAFRASISILYSVALYIGLSLALLALDSFWDIKLVDHQYEIVAIFTFILVAPLHFLHGLYSFAFEMPLFELPKYLTILVKYILSPLIVIYVVILYPYIFSFPFRSEWPANEASAIIFALHVMIYLGVVLFYGVKEGSEDEKFKKMFVRIGSILSIPTVLFWIYSLYLRIDAYGITVNRVVVMALIVWMLGTSIYLLVSKSSNIKYIISGLVLVIVSVFYLPFTAFYWGEKAQLARLVSIAKTEGIFVDGKIERGGEVKVSGNDYTMGEITAYLAKYNRGGGLKDLLGDSLLERVIITEQGYVIAKSNSSYVYYSNDAYLFSSIYFTTVNGNIPDQADYANITLDLESIPIPEGYSTVKYIEVYEDELKFNQFWSDGDIFSFDVELDLDSDDFYSTPKVFEDKIKSIEKLYTDNLELLTFKSGDKLLVVRNMYGVIDDTSWGYVSFISGYLFTK